MSVNDALDEIEKIIASAWRIPMTKGKCAVSVEELQILIDDVRLALPKEIKQAKIIVENRNDILSDARQEAKNIINNAKKQAQYMMDETTIVKLAKRKASSLISSAKYKTNEMRQKTNTYVEELITNLDRVISLTSKNFKNSANDIKEIIKKNR